MSTPPRAALAIATALLMAGGSASAVDYTGYFRAGPGLSSANTSRACYALNTGSAGMKYRLGNECDFYGEFQFTQGFEKDGLKYKAGLMVNHYNPATQNHPDKSLNIEQMWAEATGFDIAPEATFWIGKERGRRGDIHIVDTYFVEMLGVGAGAKGFKVGPGKLGVAFYKTDSDYPRPGNRVNFEYVGMPANPGGTLNFFGALTKGDFDGGTKGGAFTVRHDQDNLFGLGLKNTLWLQFAAGSAALNTNFGDLQAGRAAKSWRVVETFHWQSGPLGGQVMGLIAREKDRNGVRVDSTSVGGRLSYALTKHFKLLGEVGLSQAKPQGGETQRLTKFTFAPTLSVGPEFFTRPEFRAYVTHARWNAAAGNVTGQPALNGKTSGTSYGAQVEWWF